LALQKDAPLHRAVQRSGVIVSIPILAGLHHQYVRIWFSERTGRYPDAVAFGRKSVQQRTQFTSGHRIYIASLAQAGQIEEAREALARVKELFPEMSIAWIKQYVPYTSGPMDKFLEGMRKAGLE
jgi:hypothetical protein